MGNVYTFHVSSHAEQNPEIALVCLFCLSGLFLSRVRSCVPTYARRAQGWRVTSTAWSLTDHPSWAALTSERWVGNVGARGLGRSEGGRVDGADEMEREMEMGGVWRGGGQQGITRRRFRPWTVYRICLYRSQDPRFLTTGRWLDATSRPPPGELSSRRRLRAVLLGHREGLAVPGERELAGVHQATRTNRHEIATTSHESATAESNKATYQISCAYSSMHRSEEKNPIRDTAVMVLVSQASWSAYAASMSFCVST